ncbi:hypothetical protein TanjilG_30654 [Lupinus angustifolius]|uniref:Homeobox domain-containing protein n=1 Tax=Lupinus angustifolius TaxID=3871 RepID=A0A4P1RPA5_LUPAN|nr:PREDICTED: homeobox protein ATH1-like [Lupinus angustifolius]XP_019437859.1 PREDICTED: homeobox protein ATH1-like [Lupinus angustifolius]XP_019437860.1 PREDICTED: homeobox protein ATH1-like [Lupinus angustifolius]OIW14935.1 hypothetical protein TanjilG_30654 [Lupinus angustifolius]
METVIMYNAPMNIYVRDSSVIDEISQHSTSNPLIQSYSFVDLNNQTHIINGISILAGEHGEQPISNIISDVPFINHASIANSSSLVTSQGKNVVGDSSNRINNTEYQEHLAAGMHITPVSLAARIDLDESLDNSTVLPPSMGALEPYVFNNWQATSDPLSETFQNHVYEKVPHRGYDEVTGGNMWNNVNKFPKATEIVETVCQPYSSIGNMDPNGWTSNISNLTNHAYNSSNFSNELSLSLTTSRTAGQCSEASFPDVSSNRELAMGSTKYVQFSPLVLGSRYLVGIQQILAQIARYSFEDVEQMNGSSSAFPTMRSVLVNDKENSKFEEPHAESPLQRHAAESKKSQLLVLLQLVDDRYSQCLDEIHTVVSAFHAATELDPQIHAHFALRMISILYKEMQERISSHILGMGSDFNKSCSDENNDRCVETSFIQKQWALQQLKRKNHQLWRPQRGLPERSVSVLRDWMFQNFLHPYPKDAEKHLLAVKSGLSRSQVSNWFINARVRLWKPMIDEMYAEMSQRKACRNEQGMESSHGNRRISMTHLN